MFGAKNLGFHLEILDPKTFSAPFHFHDQEEEMLIVIEGEAVVRFKDRFQKIKAGDLVYFSTGPDSVHQTYNFTDKPFKFFALSSKFPEEKCHYPDSGKYLDKKIRKVLENGVEVDYFKNEEDPSVYWPEWALKGEIP